MFETHGMIQKSDLTLIEDKIVTYDLVIKNIFKTVGKKLS